MCGVTVIFLSHPLPEHIADLVVIKKIIFIAPAMCHISHMCVCTLSSPVLQLRPQNELRPKDP